MRRLISILAVLTGLALVPAIATGEPPEFLLAEQALSMSTANSLGQGLVVDAETGDIIVTGFFSETTIFGRQQRVSYGLHDMFVARYDRTGNLLWVVQAGGTQDDRSRGIALDSSGNILITGRFTGQAFDAFATLYSAGASDIAVAKLDPSGNMQWVAQAGGTGEDDGFDVAVDPAGDVYVTGTVFKGAPSGFFDVFVAKYSGADGSLLWPEIKTAGGTDADMGYGIAADGSGAVVTGRFHDAATFDSHSLNGFGGNDNDDIFIVNYTADGTASWAVQAGGSGHDAGFAVTRDDAGNVYVTGRFTGLATFGPTQLESSGGSDIFIAGYDAAGEFLFATRAGGPGDDTGLGIALDETGNILVTGEFSDTATFDAIELASAGDTDVFTAVYDTSGTCQSAQKAGGTGADAGFGVASRADETIATGSFQGIADAGDLHLATHAVQEMFVTVFGIPPRSPEVNQDGKLGLEDAIGIMQILTGNRP